MKACPTCAHTIEIETATACPACGRALTGAAAPAVSPPAAPKSVKPVNRSRQSWLTPLLLIFVAGAVGSLLALGYVGRESASPSTVRSGPEVPGERRAVPEATAAALPFEPPRGAIVPQWMARPLRTGRGRVTGIIFELAANEDVAVARRRVLPVLSVRCEAGPPEVFILTHTAASFESYPRQHTVEVAFDAAPAVQQMWEDSVSHDALFAPNGRALLREIVGAKTMDLRFTPFNAQPVIVHFNVQGLAAPLKSAASRCAWNS